MLDKLIANNFSIFSGILDGIVDLYQPQEDLEHTIAAWSWRVVAGSAVLLIVLVIASILFSERFPKLKLPLFISIAAVMSLSTLSLIGGTVYLNVSSDSGGPVHWHADIEYWVCGNEIELRDPVGLSNKIGTSTLHEHDDHRIHLEGVVVDDLVDASLGKFMYVTGGAITKDAMVIPINPDPSLLFENEFDGDGQPNTKPSLVQPYITSAGIDGDFVRVISGQTCGDSEAEVQVFVYNFNEENDTYEQTKLDRPQDYVITDNPNVPPGDCIIFEFDVPKEKTDKICEQYGVRDIERCEEFGVMPEERSICTIEQINYDANLNYVIMPDQIEETTVEIIEEPQSETENVQGIQSSQIYERYEGGLD